MALKVWLPLNKDTRNIGLQNIIMENHGATFSTNNNENCYYFNGSQQWLQFNQNIGDFYNNDFSVCFWINPTDDTRSIIISEYAGTGSSNVAIELRTDRVLRLYWNAAPDKSFTTAGALTKNAWTHVSILKSGRNVWVYLNGVLKETYTNSSDFPTRTSNCYPRIGDDYRGNTESTVSFQGYLRDFRMYDHLLTEEDVKRIYQKKIFDLVPYSGIKNVLFDRSGFMLMPLVNNGVVFKGNSLYFNNRAKLRPKNGNVGFYQTAEGALSIWFSMTSAPTRYNILYIDSTSKFAVGFLNSNTFIVTCNNSALATFNSTGVKYDGTLNNITVSYNTSKAPQFCLINGTQVSTTSTNNWTEYNGLTIGSRVYNDENSYFIGKIKQVQVFNSQLTQADALKLYNEERNMFLPDEYEELEYIEATSGSQYINTNVITPDNSSVVTKFESCVSYTTGASTTRQFIGLYGDYTKAHYCEIKSNKYGVNATDGYYSPTLSSGVKYHVVMQINGSTNTWYNININGNNYSNTMTLYQGDSMGRFYLFGDGSSFKTTNALRMYSAKICIDEIMVRDFIPAKRKSDNVIGMYDMVSRQFFTNSGTGSFTGA